MNAPIPHSSTPSGDGPAPSRIQAHLLHRLRETLGPDRLREELPDGSTPLARPYWQQALASPLHDFLGRGSKMIRARMTDWAWRAAGGEGALPMAFPLAVEALHAGSLVIDDIEDCAQVRRGDDALHMRYGLATALNAGNWLYFWPARLIGEAGLTPERELAALKQLNDTQYRCHLGQGLDVSLKIHDIDQADVGEVTESKTALKTGSLMGLTTYLGAVAADAPLEACEAFADFGGELGHVLQMLDDAGSILSDARGEKAKEDLMMGIATWPWAWTADRADRATYQELIGLSHDVQAGRVDYTFLRQRLRHMLEPGMDDIMSRRLDRALEKLDPVVRDARHVQAIRHEFEQMRRAYV